LHGSLSVDVPPRQNHLFRPASADQPRQANGATRSGQQSQSNLSESELAWICHNATVACEGKLETATRSAAIDGGK
jgi:hypothetical protein